MTAGPRAEPGSPSRLAGESLDRTAAVARRPCARVSDQAGAASREENGAVPGLLEPAQGDDPEKIAHVKAVGGGIDPKYAVVAPESSSVQSASSLTWWTEAAKGEVARDLQHAQSVPRCGGGANAGVLGACRTQARGESTGLVTPRRGRLRPRARCGAPRRPCGRCARRQPPDRAVRVVESCVELRRDLDLGCHSIVSHPRRPWARSATSDPLRRAEQPLEVRLVKPDACGRNEKMPPPRLSMTTSTAQERASRRRGPGAVESCKEGEIPISPTTGPPVPRRRGG